MSEIKKRVLGILNKHGSRPRIAGIMTFSGCYDCCRLRWVHEFTKMQRWKYCRISVLTFKHKSFHFHRFIWTSQQIQRHSFGFSLRDLRVHYLISDSSHLLLFFPPFPSSLIKCKSCLHSMVATCAYSDVISFIFALHMNEKCNNM